VGQCPGGDASGWTGDRRQRIIQFVRLGLPLGTVTFLFTDIEGSTRLLQELGAEGYADALAEHRRVLRGAFSRHGGVEVDTQGDAFFVAFLTAPGALAAACEAQKELELPVRMGLHTGTPLLGEEGYVGADVHRAARIAAAGHGGQVLVSAATAALVDSGELRDLGEHRLKDLSAPERIFQLGDAEFPPLKTLYRTNLPIPATPFLGRERELADVRELLARDEARLLTLMGAGGSGKTRLALHAAGEAADAYPDGVWWVPLAPLTDAANVAPTAARALGGGGTLPELVDGRRLLLVLDNFEHVVEAAPDVAAVLTDCPHADVLVTSRERLRVQGEHVYPVPVLERAEAQSLFVTRARAAQPGFEPDEHLDELCARLDDLPLAIELAAARTSLLSTEQLRERLADRLDLLRGGRDSETRQQTLRATIEWSYELLEPDERRLLAVLSVFRDGWTLEAAERVGNASLDVLESLSDKSLVRRWQSGRFGMLETIREFAAERLEESGEEEEGRRHHAEFFLQLAESANLCTEALAQGRSPRWNLVLPEHENIRTALNWLFGAGEIESAIRLAVALEDFWMTTDPIEGSRWLTELLAHGSEIPPELHVRAIRNLGAATFIVGDFEEGARLTEQSLAEYERLGDDWGVSHIKLRMAADALRREDLAAARTLCEEALESDRSAFSEACATRVLGGIAFEEGRPDEAIALLDRTAELADQVGFRWWQAGALQQAGECALTSGRPEDARPRVRAGLRVSNEIGDRQGICYGLTLLAWAEAATGSPKPAGTLWGAVDAEAQRGRIGQWEAERGVYESRLLTAAGPEFEGAVAEGRRMTLEEAVAYALNAT
jgi:predicted ATPase/class 3 adenylate cyclase